MGFNSAFKGLNCTPPWFRAIIEKLRLA